MQKDNPELIPTKYTIIPVACSELMTEGIVNWPEKPYGSLIFSLVCPILGAEFGERVRVWLTDDFRPSLDGFYTDMFVDEFGIVADRPRNDRATDLYFANVRTHEPNLVLADSYIAGPAVVFHRPVWF